MSACNCFDIVKPEFCRVTWRNAIKTHTCCECGSTIDKGEKYRYVSGMWELEWGMFHQCEICGTRWEEAEREESMEYRSCLAYGEMWDYLGQ